MVFIEGVLPGRIVLKDPPTTRVMKTSPDIRSARMTGYVKHHSEESAPGRRILNPLERRNRK